MKRYLIILVLLVAAGSVLLLSSAQVFELADAAAAQTRKRRGKDQRPVKPPIDYSRFLHQTKEHQKTCVSCHKIPTSNWQTASGFPDVADFPDHDACVSCHRPQFFRGARPAICSDCHTVVSPRADERFAFRNPKAPRQFNINFPHDKHQDVIALITRPEKDFRGIKIVKASWSTPFQQPVERKTYNNCELCHLDVAKPPEAPVSGWVDDVSPKAGAFKSQPDNHAYCFSCHWKAQAPINNQCADCHKLTSSYAAVNSPKRISMKFDHNGGGEKKAHLEECTTCHVNITKPAHLKRSEIDVPVLACKQCHAQDSGSAPPTVNCRALGGSRVIGDELNCLEADKQYTCAYCHTSNFGKLEPPLSHFLVANKKRFARKDLK